MDADTEPPSYKVSNNLDTGAGCVSPSSSLDGRLEGVRGNCNSHWHFHSLGSPMSGRLNFILAGVREK